jgi:hypothetical protein
MLLSQFGKFFDYLTIISDTLIIPHGSTDTKYQAHSANAYFIELHQVQTHFFFERRAYHFFDNTSLSIWLSRLMSAYICFNRLFSSSSSLSRLSWPASITELFATVVKGGLMDIHFPAQISYLATLFVLF